MTLRATTSSEPSDADRSGPRPTSRGLRVDIRGMSRSYRKGDRVIEVLRDVDLVIEAGERVSIIGPSGSGKSTFLHAVGLLDRGTAEAATTGRIRLDDHEVSLLSEAQRAGLRNRRIGFVFQAHHLLAEHTALGNVMIPVRIGGGTEHTARVRATALLEAVGLGMRLNHRPGELSGGEQQRVAIARALVMGPGLVLADEPTGNLDPRTAASVFGVLVDLNVQLGSTLVVVTHSRELASGFPRRLSLDDGRFEAW